MFKMWYGIIVASPLFVRDHNSLLSVLTGSNKGSDTFRETRVLDVSPLYALAKLARIAKLRPAHNVYDVSGTSW